MNKNIIFLASDASFKEDHTSILAVKDYYEDKHYQKIVKGLPGSLEAEEQALRFSIDIAITKEYNHVVFIYDCNALKPEKYIKRYGSNFLTMQLLWIPRDHISSVDKLTKKRFSESEMVLINKTTKERDLIVYDAFSKIVLSEREAFFLNILNNTDKEGLLNSERTIILSTLYVLLSNHEKKRMKRFLKEYLSSEDIRRVFKRKSRSDYLAAINFYKFPLKEELIDIMRINKVY